MDSLSFRDFLALCEAEAAPPEGGGSPPPPTDKTAKKGKPMNPIAATNFFFDIEPEEAGEIYRTTPMTGGDSIESLKRGVIRPQTLYKIDPESGKIQVLSGDDGKNATDSDADVIKGWREKKFRKAKDGGYYRVHGKLGYKGNMDVPDQGNLLYKGMDQAGAGGAPGGGMPGMM